MNVIDHSADVVAVDDGLATRAIIAGLAKRHANTVATCRRGAGRGLTAALPARSGVAVRNG